ncbi:hypothetical protein Pst134EB_008685 [Puccinia striiformis f. sp. tritici]|nr:hypothetical protein Pst134EB_008685 [Puccinia striiformis f. sp. tritici]
MGVEGLARYGWGKIESHRYPHIPISSTLNPQPSTDTNMSRGRNRSRHKSFGACSIQSSQQPVEDEPKEVEVSPLTNQEELEKAQRIAANSHSRFMIAYPCRMCGTKISRPTTDSSCSNLLKHALNCLRKLHKTEQNQTLAALGVTGTRDINPKEVPQLCAVWCAEAARPFSALTNPSHKALLHPVVLRNLPLSKAVSKDIHLLYSAIQDQYRSELQAHKGALMRGSPRTCLISWGWHTGDYLANVVRLVVEKFGIQDRICGIPRGFFALLALRRRRALETIDRDPLTMKTLRGRRTILIPKYKCLCRTMMPSRFMMGICVRLIQVIRTTLMIRNRSMSRISTKEGMRMKVIATQAIHAKKLWPNFVGMPRN